jgi:hypothetical protein
VLSSTGQAIPLKMERGLGFGIELMLFDGECELESAAAVPPRLHWIPDGRDG